MRPLSNIVAISASKITRHPLSQSCDIDIRAPLFKFGNMYARLAVFGNIVNFNSASCVDFNIVPFGKLTEIGFFVVFLFTHGIFICKYTLEHPESNIAISFLGNVGCAALILFNLLLIL